MTHRAMPIGSSALRPIGTNVHLPVRVSRNLSDGTELSASTTMRHSAVRSAETVRLLYANWINDAGAEAPGPNPITVTSCTIVHGGRIDITFEGEYSVRIAPGAQVLSDPLHVQLTSGDEFSTTTTVAVENWGDRFPLGSQSHAVTDSYGFGPRLILGEQDDADERPLVLVVGDSNAVGYGDSVGGTSHYGWVRRACEPDVAHINLGISGATARGAATGEEMCHRLALLRWVRPGIALTAFGTNDLAGVSPNVDDVARMLRAHWKVLNSLGVAVVACTIPPNTTSVDGWTTVDGQTPADGESARATINEWIRKHPEPLRDVIDLADVVEYPSSGGRWRPGHTDDGLHLNSKGHGVVAELVNEYLVGQRGEVHSHAQDNRKQIP